LNLGRRLNNLTELLQLLQENGGINKTTVAFCPIQLRSFILKSHMSTSARNEFSGVTHAQHGPLVLGITVDVKSYLVLAL